MRQESPQSRHSSSDGVSAGVSGGMSPSRLLARYRLVLSHAWAHRHELAGPERLASEAAFLPAALSIRETPPHPAPRRALWAICALFVIAVSWAAFGQVDVVAVAPGRIIVSERSKVIQPLDTASINSIHVHDGDHVKKGDLLIELDATQATAENAQAKQELVAAQSEKIRVAVLTQGLLTGHLAEPSIDKISVLCESSQKTCDAWSNLQQQLATEWQDISSKRDRLTASASTRSAQVQATKAAAARYQSLIISLRLRENDYSTLAQKGFINQHAYQDKSRDRLDAENELTRLQAEQITAVAAHQEAVKEQSSYLAEVKKNLSSRNAEAMQHIDRLEQERIKIEQRLGILLLRAPVDGLVQQLAMHTNGGVVTPAQPLMVIVPNQGGLVAEVMVTNKDIGFVRKGQPVRVKLETFNFTRYGTLDGELEWVSADALTRDPQPASGAASIASNGQAPLAYFPAHVRLKQTSLHIDGKDVPINAGMNITAEIQTGKRSLLDYLLSPIQRTLDESAKER